MEKSAFTAETQRAAIHVCSRQQERIPIARREPRGKRRMRTIINEVIAILLMVSAVLPAMTACPTQAAVRTSSSTGAVRTTLCDGLNCGEDYIGQVYYNLAGAGYTCDGATNGGAARIRYREGVFTVESGLGDHPVTYVSWYGATAFGKYYGYRLPSEWEWQAVADYDGSYTYGCGTSIDNTLANYMGSPHPNGTTAVGAFGLYGYGLYDMEGNVWEWTSTAITSNYCVLRGGSWDFHVNFCKVSSRNLSNPYSTDDYSGFRVCR